MIIQLLNSTNMVIILGVPNDIIPSYGILCWWYISLDIYQQHNIPSYGISSRSVSCTTMVNHGWSGKSVLNKESKCVKYDY